MPGYRVDRRRHRLDGLPARAGGRRARHRGRAVAGRDRRPGVRRGARGGRHQRRHPGDGGRGTQGVPAGQHLSPDAERHAGGLRAGRRRGRHRDRLDPPVRGDERHVRVSPAGGEGVDRAGARRRQPAGRRRHRLRRAVGGRRPRRRRVGARGRGGGPCPRRGGDVPVLRRHPGVPAARRPHRRGRRDLRGRAVGQAAAHDHRWQGRQPREGAHRREGVEPPGGTRRWRRPGTARSTCASPTWPATTGPSSWPSG